MKPCRKHNSLSSAGTPAPVSRVTDHVPVHRYSHPIRSRAPSGQGTEELLSGILEAISRQSELLEELLRRTGTENCDRK